MKLTDERLRDIESWAHKLTPLSAPILGDQIGSMARELLLLRAECRAARAYKVRHETASLRNTTAAWLNFGESTKVYEITCKATDDAGFAP